MVSPRVLIAASCLEDHTNRGGSAPDHDCGRLADVCESAARVWRRRVHAPVEISSSIQRSRCDSRRCIESASALVLGSVVIPAHNALPRPDARRSARQRPKGRVRAIVVDDGTTDEAATAALPPVPNVGVALARAIALPFTDAEPPSAASSSTARRFRRPVRLTAGVRSGRTSTSTGARDGRRDRPVFPGGARPSRSAGFDLALVAVGVAAILPRRRRRRRRRRVRRTRTRLGRGQARWSASARSRGLHWAAR